MAKRRKRHIRHSGFLIQDLWEKYEDIAMHFNELIMKLRIQALAGVAALSTVAGIFAKTIDLKLSWGIAIAVIAILCLLWIAIWIIDFTYYNKLLIGAVVALMDLEAASKRGVRVQAIQLSTTVERAVEGRLGRLGFRRWLRLSFGRWAFYILVMLALISAMWLCYEAYLDAPVRRSTIPGYPPEQ
jgi:hypothetical protein